MGMARNAAMSDKLWAENLMMAEEKMLEDKLIIKETARQLKGQ